MMAPYGWVLWGWCPMMVLMCEVLYLTCLHLRTPFCFSSFFLIEKFYPVTCAGWQFQTREVHSQSEATSSKGSGAYPNTNPVHSPPPQKPRGMKKFMSLFSPEMMLVCRVVLTLSKHYFTHNQNSKQVDNFSCMASILSFPECVCVFLFLFPNRANTQQIWACGQKLCVPYFSLELSNFEGF
jgi:hypothetical protein